MIKKRVPDYLGSREESQRLANRIAAYWHALGNYNVRVWVEPIAETLKRKPGRTLWQIRSNIRFTVPNV